MRNKVKKIVVSTAFIIVWFVTVLVSIFIIRGNNDLMLITICVFLLYSIMQSSYFETKVISRVRGLLWSIFLLNRPKKLKVGKHVKLFNCKCVKFGSNCNIADNVVFAPLTASQGEKYNPSINVGSNVHFGVQDRIAAMDTVIIEDDVLLAAFVHITDHSHEYRNPNCPIHNQGVFSKGPVIIKKGAWLAFGCHVLSGVTVGENAVVAANSVVTKDVPPFSVVAGNPARIIYTYDASNNKWIKQHNQGED